MKNKLAITGTFGAIIAALCCFTTFLANSLLVISLGGLMGYLYNDAVLLHVLAVFLALAGYGFWNGKTA